IIDCILDSQALQIVSRGKLLLPVEIIIIRYEFELSFDACPFCFVCWLFKRRILDHCNRALQVHPYLFGSGFHCPLISFITMYAVFGHNFTSSPVPETDTSDTYACNILSYMTIIFGGNAGWIPVSADYYIYFPEITFATTYGAGFASVTLYNPEWAAAYTSSDTDFIGAVLSGLGNAILFFIFLLGWFLISNNIFNLTASDSRRSCSANGQTKLLDLYRHWHLDPHYHSVDKYILIRSKFELDLTAWNERTRLPPGYAADITFCFGIMGAVLRMNQSWYQGKIGGYIGKMGRRAWY
ncbi:hypothetical protein B0J14DRAFT_677645, partial [Halenospora varia]